MDEKYENKSNEQVSLSVYLFVCSPPISGTQNLSVFSKCKETDKKFLPKSLKSHKSQESNLLLLNK